jgi:hypothetical protein
VIRAVSGPAGTTCLEADDSAIEIDPRLPPCARLGRRWLVAPAVPPDRTLFTDNETNGPAVFGPGFEEPSSAAAGRGVTLRDMAGDLAGRLKSIFL